MTNQDYKNAALAALKGNWAPAVVCTIVLILIVYAVSGEMVVPTFLTTDAKILGFCTGGGYLLLFLIYYPVFIGYYNSTKALVSEGDNNLTSNMFKMGFGRYLHNVWGALLMMLKIFAWTLLFIIPGIIKSFSYAMTPYILYNEPELSAWKAIKKSKAMMKGHKFDLFYLYLSFIGWILLAVLTLGIGLIWLLPYMQCSIAEFYRDVKSQYEAGTVNA